MKKLILIICAALLFTALVAEKMPDFRLPDMANKDVTLASLLGKGPVLIDFWASWCTPCKNAMPPLHSLAESYDSLTVVLISIDAPKDVAKAKNFLKSKQYKFVPLFDSEKSLASKLNVKTVPHTFIIDREGNIVYSHVGFDAGTEKKYDGIIRKMLNLETADE